MCQREWHDDQAKTEVSECQGRDEPVLHSVEAVLGGDGDDDEHVAHHHNDHHDGDNDGQDDDLCGGILTGIAVGQVPIHHWNEE